MGKKVVLLTCLFTFAYATLLSSQTINYQPQNLADDSTEEQTDGPIITGKNRLLLGLSLSLGGASLLFLSNIFHESFIEARNEYNDLDSESASVEDVESKRKKFSNSRLRYYSTLITGIGLSSYGLYFSLSGVFTVDFYDQGDYQPSVGASELGIVVSPGFTGVQIRR